MKVRTLTYSRTAKQLELRDICAGLAKHILAVGGSRSGKTFGFCEFTAQRAIKAPGSRHAIFRKHNVAVRQSIGMDTFPKACELAYGIKPEWKDRDGYFRFPNESEVWLAGLDDKDRVDKVLGKEYSTLYFNEASEIAFDSYMVAQTRLAQSVSRVDGKPLALKSYVDLNPTTRSHWTYRLWIDGVNPDGEIPIDQSDYAHLFMNPVDNRDNLPQSYIKSLEQLPPRQRKRFFEGVYTADAENALWRRDIIRRTQTIPDLERVVVAIDPAVTSQMGSNETGIICAGIDKNKIGYILADESGVFSPDQWARRSIALYRQHNADRIIGEVNNGGDMIEAVIRAQDPHVSYSGVRASRGKYVRAEPIAALYELNKVYHVGEFSTLEDQMCAFTSDFDRKAQGYSPDRMDALVWALTELFPTMTRKQQKPIEAPIPTYSPFRR